MNEFERSRAGLARTIVACIGWKEKLCVDDTAEM